MGPHSAQGRKNLRDRSHEPPGLRCPVIYMRSCTKKQVRRSVLGGILLPDTICMAGVGCRLLKTGPELQIRLAGCIHHHQ